MGFVSDHADRRFIRARPQPLDECFEGRVGLEDVDDLADADIKCVGDVFGRLLRAHEWAGGKQADLRYDGTEPAGGALHFFSPLVGERTHIVALSRFGELLLVLGDAVTHDQKIHNLTI